MRGSGGGGVRKGRQPSKCSAPVWRGVVLEYLLSLNIYILILVFSEYIFNIQRKQVLMY